MTPIRLLVIDDDLTPGVAERSGLVRRFGAREAPLHEYVPTAGSTGSERLVSFSTGQDASGSYSYKAVQSAVQAGPGPDGWSLILLDVAFGSQKHFGETARRQLHKEHPDLPVVLLTGKHRGELQDPSVPFRSKDDLNGRMLVEDLLRYGRLTLEQERALLSLSENEIAVSSDMRRVFRQAFVLAASEPEINVVLLGESGVGKEVVAQYVHRVSKRRNRPFVAENMGTVGAGDMAIVNSRLFGRRPRYLNPQDPGEEGLFGQANGGTLFLDEIADLPLDTQGMLLRVLQEKRYRRVGEDEPRGADVRLLTATLRDLDALIEVGAFREDLSSRIRGATLVIPPLRERPEDILPLAEHLLASAMRVTGKRNVDLSASARQALLELPLPGNVRTVQRIIENVIVYKGHNDVIDDRDVREAHAVVTKGRSSKPPGQDPIKPLLSEAPVTLANLPEILATLPVSKNDPALDGSLHRLEEAYALLKRRLAGAALARSTGPGSPQPNITEAGRRLLHDHENPDQTGSIKPYRAIRLMLGILGEKQANSMTDEQVQALIDAWEQEPPRKSPPTAPITT